MSSRAPPDRARAARRARPVGDRDAQHGAVDRAAHAAARRRSAEQAARLIADESSRLYDAMHGIIPRLTPLVLDNFGLGRSPRTTWPSARGAAIPVCSSSLQIDLGRRAPARRGRAGAVPRGAGRHHQRVGAMATRSGLQLTVDAQRAARCGSSSSTTAAGCRPTGRSASGHYGLRWLAERVQALAGELRHRARSNPQRRAAERATAFRRHGDGPHDPRDAGRRPCAGAHGLSHAAGRCGDRGGGRVRRAASRPAQRLPARQARRGGDGSVDARHGRPRGRAPPDRAGRQGARARACRRTKTRPTRGACCRPARSATWPSAARPRR